VSNRISLQGRRFKERHAAREVNTQQATFAVGITVGSGVDCRQDITFLITSVRWRWELPKAISCSLESFCTWLSSVFLLGLCKCS
jgi:hypothetical protein